MAGRHRFAFALLALIALVFFAEALVRQEVPLIRDHFDYFQPLRWFTAQELSAGRLPLWNPWSASGEPWLANPQTGVFYPPAWLFLALRFETAYVLFLAGHLILLGWSAYLLFSRSVSRGAALVGATALMLSGPVMSVVDVSNNLATMAWIPLALWCAAEGAWRRGAFALALAFLGGEPFFAALGAAACACVAVFAGPGDRASRVGRLVLCAVAAFGISAIQLLPFLEMLRGSDRAAGIGESEVLLHSVAAGDWVRLVIPPRPGDWIDSALGQRFIPVVYLGMSVALLAILGIVATIRRRETRVWIAVMAAAAVVASGPGFVAHLPLTPFRYPARLLPFVALAAAALAAIGWNRIRPDRRWADLLLVAVMVIDLGPRVRPLLRSGPFDPHPVPWDAAIGARSKLVRMGEMNVYHRPAWIAGYLNLYDRRFDAFTAAPVISETYLSRYEEAMRSPSREAFASLGIEYVVTNLNLPAPFIPVAENPAAVIFRNPDVLPMAACFSQAPLRIRRVRWSVDTRSASIVVDAPRAGIVVLRQQAAPGWRVAVDGKEARPLIVDGMFRAVDVSEGRHEIVWEYHPPSLRAGVVTTLGALLFLFLSLFVKPSAEVSSAKDFSSIASDDE